MMLRLFARGATPASSASDAGDPGRRRHPTCRPHGPGRQPTSPCCPCTAPSFPKSNLMTQASGATAIGPVDRHLRELARRRPRTSRPPSCSTSTRPAARLPASPKPQTRMRPAVAGRKPVVAVSNFLCASAAYWIAAQADQIVAAPSLHDRLASACIAIHESIAAALEAEGVDVTIISAGKFKAEGNPYEELDPEAYRRDAGDRGRRVLRPVRPGRRPWPRHHHSPTCAVASARAAPCPSNSARHGRQGLVDRDRHHPDGRSPSCSRPQRAQRQCSAAAPRTTRRRWRGPRNQSSQPMSLQTSTQSHYTHTPRGSRGRHWSAA